MSDHDHRSYIPKTLEGMETKHNWSYRHVVLAALSAELILIAIQFIAVRIYSGNTDAESAVFTSAYMKSTGFYVFLVGGFFLYVVLTFGLLRNIREYIVRKLFVLLITGAVVEVAFYLSIQATYEGAFLYSIFDKAIAIAMGLILFNFASDEKRHPESYF